MHYFDIARMYHITKKDEEDMKKMIELKLNIEIDQIRTDLSPLGMDPAKPGKKRKNRRRSRSARIRTVDATMDNDEDFMEAYEEEGQPDEKEDASA